MRSTIFFVIYYCLVEVLRVAKSANDNMCVDLKREKRGLGADHFFPDLTLYNAFNFNNRGPITQTFNVEVYGIKIKNDENKLVPLNGWLHLVIRYPRPYKGLIVQAEDLKGASAGLGEFVHDFPYEACTIIKSEITRKETNIPKNHQFLPCNGANKYDPLNSNMFVYNDDAPREFIPAFAPKVLNLFWRVTNYHCNHLSLISFRMYVAEYPVPVTKKGYRAYSTFIYFTNKLTGAPDPIPAPTQVVDCREDLNDKNSIHLEWIEKTVINRTHTQYFDPQCREVVNNNFRCNRGSQQCRNQPSVVGASDEYNDYVTKISNAVELSGACPLIPQKSQIEPSMHMLKPVTKLTTTTTRQPKNFQTVDPGQEHEVEEKDRNHGVYADKYPGSIVWKQRVWHGMAGIIGTVFVTPISNFASRYYKETFMEVKMCFNSMCVWYMVHLLSVFVNFQLHLYGCFSINISKALLGYNKSKTASLHAYVGWCAIVIFGFMTVLGGFRPWNYVHREITIGLHWCLGMTYYVLCLIAAASSVYIYGSPSASSDMSVNPQGHQAIFGTIIFWIVFDITCHIAMTIEACLMDTVAGLRRRYWPVIIPIANEHHIHNHPGYMFRKKMLLFYISISTFITFILCCMIYFNSPNQRGFGIMSCTHNEEDNFVNIADECRHE